jgi:hypothetical protein
MKTGQKSSENRFRCPPPPKKSIFSEKRLFGPSQPNLMEFCPMCPNCPKKSKKPKKGGNKPHETGFGVFLLKFHQISSDFPKKGGNKPHEKGTFFQRRDYMGFFDPFFELLGPNWTGQTYDWQKVPHKPPPGSPFFGKKVGQEGVFLAFFRKITRVFPWFFRKKPPYILGILAFFKNKWGVF